MSFLAAATSYPVQTHFHCSDRVRPPEILALKHESRIHGQWSNLYVVQGRAKPVLHGPNSTEPNLFHHGETTHMVGWMSENPTLGFRARNSAVRPILQMRLFSRSSPTSSSSLFDLQLYSGMGDGDVDREEERRGPKARVLLPLSFPLTRISILASLPQSKAMLPCG